MHNPDRSLSISDVTLGKQQLDGLPSTRVYLRRFRLYCLPFKVKSLKPIAEHISSFSIHSTHHGWFSNQETAETETDIQLCRYVPDHTTIPVLMRQNAADSS